MNQIQDYQFVWKRSCLGQYLQTDNYLASSSLYHECRPEEQTVTVSRCVQAEAYTRQAKWSPGLNLEAHRDIKQQKKSQKLAEGSKKVRRTNPEPTQRCPFNV